LTLDGRPFAASSIEVIEAVQDVGGNETDANFG
jgi:hypothetical protein